MTEATGALSSDAEVLQGESSVANSEPDEPPAPENYASEELWSADYSQWLIDHGYGQSESESAENSDDEIGSSDADSLSGDSENSSESISTDVGEANDEPPAPENYASEELWSVDYSQWLIDHGYGQSESESSWDSGDEIAADAAPLTRAIDASPRGGNILLGQGIATVGIGDRELAECDTASSDSAFGELADSEPEDGDALAANGDTNSADMGEGLELDAALSNEFLTSLTQTLPTNASF